MAVGTKPRLLMRIAWLIIILSGLTIGGCLLWDLAVALWSDRSQPIWLRVSLAVFYVVFTVLFLIILRERLMERKTNKAP